VKQAASLLSGLLAIASACAGLMGITTMGHSLLTPQSRLPRMHDEGPSLLLRVGIATTCAAIVLGILSYVLARVAAARKIP
jgi:hypothetical protein